MILKYTGFKNLLVFQTTQTGLGWIRKMNQMNESKTSTFLNQSGFKDDGLSTKTWPSRKRKSCSFTGQFALLHNHDKAPDWEDDEAVEPTHLK